MGLRVTPPPPAEQYSSRLELAVKWQGLVALFGGIRGWTEAVGAKVAVAFRWTGYVWPPFIRQPDLSWMIQWFRQIDVTEVHAVVVPGRRRDREEGLQRWGPGSLTDLLYRCFICVFVCVTGECGHLQALTAAAGPGLHAS